MFMQRVLNFFRHGSTAAPPPPAPTPATAVQREFAEAADRLTQETRKLADIVSNGDPLDELVRDMRGACHTKKKRRTK